MAITKVTTPVTDFDKATSLPGLKIPSGDNSNQPAGAAAEQGMIRNDNEETVGSSDSAIAHYNGTAWQYFAATESPDPPFAVDYLVVAGGGGGSSGYGGTPQGGGGAGGLRTSYGSISGGGASAETPFSYQPGTAYSLTVGVGGAGAAAGNGTIGTSGGVSSFDAISTVGGGASRSYSSSSPSGNGGSGGGMAWSNNGGPGTGTINQGFDGGSDGGSGGGAGGGGAGSAGSWGASPVYSIGGNGIDIDITGSTVDYAGGGGRTSGTPRGGGGISASVNGVGGNGLPNTGGGGGGGKGNDAGGNGGSGVVILRYPTGHTASSTLAFTDAIVSGSTDRVITITGTGTGTVTIT